MNQDQVKSMLLELENTELEFTLIFSGKESKRVNGLYKPDTHEIILHNHNFKNDNQLIYTAIHEYTHHLINEGQEKSAIAKKTARVHTNEFWAHFHGLLEVAEGKGFYSIGVNASPELLAITENIKKNYLEKIAILTQELGSQLTKAHEVCIAAGVRYEDYLDRCLQISKKEARSAVKTSVCDVDPSLGYESMKMVAEISSPDKRAEAQQLLSEGKSQHTVRDAMKEKDEGADEKVILEKEKARLEKTITKMGKRVGEIDDIILNGFVPRKDNSIAYDKVFSFGRTNHQAEEIKAMTGMEADAGYAEAVDEIVVSSEKHIRELFSSYGVTGFQASWVMSRLLLNIQFSNNKCGIKITNYDNMLYPQYEEEFGKIISKAIWDALQKEAGIRLLETGACDSVKAHWRSIVDGVVPFGFKVSE